MQLQCLEVLLQEQMKALQETSLHPAASHQLHSKRQDSVQPQHQPGQLRKQHVEGNLDTEQ